MRLTKYYEFAPAFMTKYADFVIVTELRSKNVFNYHEGDKPKLNPHLPMILSPINIDIE